MGNKKSLFLFLSLLALGLYIFFALFESYEEMQDAGWSRAALRNPYLAAEQLLGQEGLTVQSENRFEKLIQGPENSTLFISNSNHVFSSKRLDALLQWIKNGGHLIAAAAPPSENDGDRLLDYFSIEVRKVGETSNAAAENEAAKVPKKLSEQLRELNEKIKQRALNEQERAIRFEKTVHEHERTALVFEGLDVTLNIHFSAKHSLHHPYLDWEGDEADFKGLRPFYAAGDARGTHFMQIRLEKGMLSVFSDASIWRSENVGHFDHAYLLRVLTAHSKHFGILYGLNMPSLVTLMRRHFPELIFSSVLWLAAWLRYRGQRFGPVRKMQIAVRRSMAEHVFAAAAYLWRGGWKSQLLLPLQKEIEARAPRILPAFSNLEKAARDEGLSLTSGQSPEAIKKAMRTTDPQTEEDFVEAVQCLQKIRSAL